MSSHKRNDVIVAASAIAHLVMGRTDHPRRRGYNPPRAWAADEDPLAWWTLTELLIAFHEDPGRIARNMVKMMPQRFTRKIAEEAEDRS